MTTFHRGTVLLLCSLLAISRISAGADELRAVTVPFLGDLTGQHQVLEGKTILLQGTAVVPDGATLTEATWDPGDGDPAVGVSTSDPRILELGHTYRIGPDGKETPWVARLTVKDSAGHTASDTFRVLVVPSTAPARKKLDVERNMAIDRGLWYLHKQMELSTAGDVPTGIWRKGCDYCNLYGIQSTSQRAAATASTVMAFEVNGHYETGDRAVDPYVDDVARGLAHLMTELETVSMTLQGTKNPDSNGNGIGLSAPVGGKTDGNYRPVYVTGQLVDAIVASRTPDAVAGTGAQGVIGRTYAEIVQDMIDMYAWGQVDSGTPQGGWQYAWNSGADNSANQWAAIAALAAERNKSFKEAGVKIPQFMKDEVLLKWIPNSQQEDGAFGYQGKDLGAITQVCGRPQNLTASGLVQLVFTGRGSTYSRFINGQKYLADNWTGFYDPCIRIYGMYAAMKAFTFVLQDPEHPENPQSPFTTLQGTSRSFDWFWSEVAAGDPVDGFVRQVVKAQQPSGRWDEPVWAGGASIIVDHLATAWAVTILSSRIIQPPVAVCSVEPEVSEGEAIALDGSRSFHMDPARRIVRYEWDLDGDGVFETGSDSWSSEARFTGLGFHDVCLRVIDDSTPPLTSLPSCCRVEVVPPPRPPNADPGGPYCFCSGVHKVFILDGSRSSVSPDRIGKDPAAKIVSYLWDLDPPFDAHVDKGPVFNATDELAAMGPGKYDISLKVIDDLGNEDTDTTTVTIVSGFEDCACVCRQRIGVQIPGDATQDGRVDIGDAIWLLGNLFMGTNPVLPCEGSTSKYPGSGDLALLDWNGDLRLEIPSPDISDPICILNFLFMGTWGPHVLGSACTPIPGCPDNKGCQGNIPSCDR